MSKEGALSFSFVSITQKKKPIKYWTADMNIAESTERGYRWYGKETKKLGCRILISRNILLNNGTKFDREIIMTSINSEHR